MAKKVTVYSTPTCPYCEMAKDFLKEKGIKFEVVNVAEDQAAAKKIIDETKQMNVPVIQIDDDYVVGFDEEQLTQLLDIKP